MTRRALAARRRAGADRLHRGGARAPAPRASARRRATRAPRAATRPWTGSSSHGRRWRGCCPTPLHADRNRQPPGRLPVRRRRRGGDDGAGRRQPRWALARRARHRGAGQGLARATRSRGRSCPLQKALRDLREPRRSGVRALEAPTCSPGSRAHPEVDTVFVAGLTGGSGVVPSGGRSRFETAVAGYAEAWAGCCRRRAGSSSSATRRAWPGDTDHCVPGAASRGTTPGAACAVTRARRLDRDPAMRGRRAGCGAAQQTIDLTPFFCDARVLPGDRRRARAARHHAHDRDLRDDARALPVARGRPAHGSVTASVKVSALV